MKRQEKPKLETVGADVPQTFDGSAPIVKEGTIVGFFGTIGSGKGVLSAREAMLTVRREKIKRILTNAPLVPGKWPVPVTFFSNERIAAVGLDDLREGDLFYVDEASLIWDAMKWKQVDDDNSELAVWVAQARKKGVHFLIVSQAFEEFVVFIRRKMVCAWLCWRFGPFAGARCFTVEPGGKLGTAFGTPFIFLKPIPPKWCTLFNSTQLVGTGAAGTVKVRRNLLGLKWPLFVVLALVVGVVALKGSFSGTFGARPTNPGKVLAAAASPARFNAAREDLPKGESYDRSTMLFRRVDGAAVDPHLGMSGPHAADWGAEWDAVARQINDAGGRFNSGNTQQPPRSASPNGIFGGK